MKSLCGSFSALPLSKTLRQDLALFAGHGQNLRRTVLELADGFDARDEQCMEPGGGVLGWFNKFGKPVSGGCRSTAHQQRAKPP